MATIKRVQGNRLELAIPLQTETMTPSGKVVADYNVPEGAEVRVLLVSAWKNLAFVPTSVSGNLVTVVDNGTLPTGKYAVEVRIKEADGTPLRSKYCNIIEVCDCNDGVTTQYDDFIEGSVQLDAQVFWFAKGDKGDPFTFADFTQEQIELLQQPAQDKANEVTELQEQWTEAEAQRSQAETLRQQAEQGREQAEGARQTTFLQNEQQRQTTFDTNEQARQEAERQREVAEGGRKNAEEQRNTSEEHRQTNEQARNDAEVLREQNESKRQQDTQTAINNAEQATSEAENVNARLSSDGGVVILTITNRQGYQTSKEVGFRIAKTYPNVAAMNADLANVEEGRFVMIAGSTEDVDTGKLYVRGASAFTFITDLSGAQGIKGDTGNGIASVTLNADYTLTIVFTDGTSTTTTSIRGEKGDPFTYDDFTPEQITELQRPATEAADKMKDDVQMLIENTDAVLGADDIPQFDETERYAIGDFVMKDGKLYKFLAGHEPGAWNPQEVQQTNLVKEVDEMVKSDYEEVIIDLKTETGDPLPNVEVVVTVEGEQSGRNLTTDAQGRCTTNVQKGLEYTVSCANVPNYLPVTDIVRRASLPTRYITVTYVEDDTLTRETVKITVGYSDQTLPKATWVRISYGGENYQLALNDENIAETTVRLGTVYTVSFEDIDGYKTPSPQTYTASLHGTRNINVSYVAPVAGLKWLMANNTERELNDVSDAERINGDIFGLIVQTSDLMAAGCSFVIPLPFLLTQSATGTGQWLSANVTVPQLNYFGSLQAALADFDGDANCAGIEQFIAEKKAEGTNYTSSMVSNCRGRVGGAPSFDDTKDYEAGDYVIYRNHLHLFQVAHAAGPWVDGETEQMTGFLMPDGVVRKCFSPAFAQIYAFRLLRDKVNEFTTSVFGIGSCNIARGLWWSSTQCDASNGVSMRYGGFNYNTKYSNGNLLPVLAY